MEVYALKISKIGKQLVDHFKNKFSILNTRQKDETFLHGSIEITDGSTTSSQGTFSSEKLQLLQVFGESYKNNINILLHFKYLKH